KRPEGHRSDQKRDSVEFGNELPAIVSHQRRSDEHIDGGAGGSRAEYSHRETAPLLGKEARDVGSANGKRGADHAERQAKQQELPQLSGIAGEPDRSGAGDQQQEHDNSATKPIRPDTERQAE